jgi:hypothetical protein
MQPGFGIGPVTLPPHSMKKARPRPGQFRQETDCPNESHTGKRKFKGSTESHIAVVLKGWRASAILQATHCITLHLCCGNIRTSLNLDPSINSFRAAWTKTEQKHQKSQLPLFPRKYSGLPVSADHWNVSCSTTSACSCRLVHLNYTDWECSGHPGEHRGAITRKRDTECWTVQNNRWDGGLPPPTIIQESGAHTGPIVGH